MGSQDAYELAERIMDKNPDMGTLIDWIDDLIRDIFNHCKGIQEDKECRALEAELTRIIKNNH